MSQSLRFDSSSDSVVSYSFRSASSPRFPISLSFPSSGRTKQYFKDECDINFLMSRYMQTGVLPGDPERAAQARYLDVTPYQEMSYQDMFNLVAEAHEQFSMLPSKVRDRFLNDPGRFIAFMEDPANAQEAISLGLLPDPMSVAPTVPLGATASVSGISPADQAK